MTSVWVVSLRSLVVSEIVMISGGQARTLILQYRRTTVSVVSLRSLVVSEIIMISGGQARTLILLLPIEIAIAIAIAPLNVRSIGFYEVIHIRHGESSTRSKMRLWRTQRVFDFANAESPSPVRMPDRRA